MDKITRDIALKTPDWEKLISQMYRTVFSTMYNMYVLCVSIGIMYDQQIDVDPKEEDPAGQIPRNVLVNNKEELEILFQTAILTSDQISFSEDERLELAFGDTNPIKDFDQLNFLTRFANYGAKVLAEKMGDDVLESMENIKDLLSATVAGLNFEIDPIDLDALDIDVDDLLG